VNRRLRDWTLVLAVGLAAGLAGYGYNTWRTAPGPAHAEAATRMLAAQFPDLQGRTQPIGQWRGKVLIVNFWATWCAPCREEIPLFVRLQQAHGGEGLQFVGIAIDQLDPVRAFAAEFGVNYPVLLGDIGAIDLARELGNRAGVLPFTVIVSREGELVATEVGVLNEARLAPLLKQLL
jgi:thiol-disulfide isomerase/thioredoxin